MNRGIVYILIVQLLTAFTVYSMDNTTNETPSHLTLLYQMCSLANQNAHNHNMWAEHHLYSAQVYIQQSAYIQQLIAQEEEKLASSDTFKFHDTTHKYQLQAIPQAHETPQNLSFQSEAMTDFQPFATELYSDNNSFDPNQFLNQ